MTIGYYDEPVVKAPVWTWEVPVYFWLGGLAGGAYLTATASRLFGTPEDRRTAGRGFYVAAIAALLCPPLLIADLGRPDRFHYMLRIFKPQSPMNLGAWTLAFFSPLAVLRAIAQAADDNLVPSALRSIARLLPRRLLGLTGTFFGLLLAGYTGVLLGASNIPVWAKSKLLPAVFTASGAASGAAAVVLAAGTAGPSAQTLSKLGAIESIAAGTELGLVAGYVAQSGKTADPLVRGRNRLLFWLGAVGLGQLLPLLLHTLAGRRPGRMRALGTVGAVATIVGSLCLRWSIFSAGRDSAHDQAASFDLSR
jgi:formate-dependent nitrite reductase membrane component NrfD